MTIAIFLVVFLAGIACGLALRPSLDRRRRVKFAYAMARERRATQRATEARQDDAPVQPPRDYYSADRNARGSLAESFGLKQGGPGAAGNAAEPDLSGVPMPRDYYERESPEDEGLLSEGFGLKRKEDGQA